MNNDLDWDRFPKFEDDPKWTGIKLLKNELTIALQDLDNPLPIPYHFTLEVMKAIYNRLHGITSEERNSPKDVLLCRPLRAIAYFSWENENRIFLARRVHPPPLGFLSYSHVPQGWGALGMMLNEVMNQPYSTRIYTSIEDVGENSTLLPYLREARRLEYESVLVLPIFKGDKTNISNLLGGIVFYLKDRSCLPEPDIVRDRFERFASAMQQTFTAHDEKILREVDPIAWERGLKPIRNYTGQLIIKLHPQGQVDFLERITTEIAAMLKGSDCYSTVLSSKDQAETLERKIIFTGREGFTGGNLKAQVSSAVGNACVVCGNEEFISFRFDFYKA